MFQFVIIKGRRPILEDFTSSITVTRTKDEAFLALNPAEDSLYYMAVLPNKQMVIIAHLLLIVCAFVRLIRGSDSFCFSA